MNRIQSYKVIFNITFNQIIRSKKTILMLIVTFLPVFVAIYYRTSANTDMIMPEQALSQIMIFFLLFLSILVSLFYGTALMADEIDNRTITYIFTRPIRKYYVVLWKFLSFLLGSFIILIPPMVLTFLLVSTDSRMSFDFGTSLVLFTKQLGIAILSILAYGAIFTFFGSRLKHPMIIGLLFAFGWEKIILIIPGIVRKFSVAHYLLSSFPKDPSIQRAIDHISRGADSSFAASISIITLVTVVFLCLSMYTAYSKEYAFEQ